MNLNPKQMALTYFAGAVAVFIVCSIVQGIGGTSMFSDTYSQPDSAFLDFLLQVTWWPGWILIIALLVGAGKSLVAKD